MLNPKLIYKILGSLLFIESIFMALCLIISMGYGEDDILSFSISTLYRHAASILRYVGRRSTTPQPVRTHFSSSLLHGVSSVFSALCIYRFALYTQLTNAYFETISSFTLQVLILTMWNNCHTEYSSGAHREWIADRDCVLHHCHTAIAGGSSMKVFAAESTGPIN